MTIDLSQKYLKEVLVYDEDTGIFKWKRRYDTRKEWNTRYAGKDAGGVGKSGYHEIRINLKMYKAHRLAWLYVTGEWPKDQIDHINRVKQDNRIINLREANNKENQHNQVLGLKNNKTGFRGVSWDKKNKKFKVQIKINGEQKYIGCFTVLEDAHNAYVEAKRKLHPFCSI